MLKPSVLLIGNFLSESLGGRRTVGEDLAERLRQRGYTVFWASRRRNRLARLADMINTAWSRRTEYEIAHVEVYSGSAFVWAEATCAVLRWVGRPYILALHGGNLPRFAQHSPRRVSRLLRSAAAVIAPSPYLAQAASPFRSDVCILPNALDLSLYPYQIRKTARPNLIWLRSFHQMYNPMLAVRILGSLVGRFPDVRLTMVGPDRGDGSLQKTKHLGRELGVFDRITFAGPIPKSDVPVWLNRGDVFLNTTDVDNTPVSVLEAMACGLCIVSTNAGGLAHFLRHDVDALLAPCGNPEAMAEPVERVLSEPGLAERLSREGRKGVEKLDWASVLPQWDRILGSVVSL